MTEQSDWPKPWKQIMTENSGHGISSFKRDWVEFDGGVRGYKETLYVSIDAGKVTEENRDAWLPFDMYVRRVLAE